MEQNSSTQPEMAERDKEAEQLMDVKDPAWRWPTYERWFSNLEGTWKVKEVTRSADEESLLKSLNCPFKVAILVDEDDPRDVTVTVFSKYLITILRKLLPRTVEALCCEEPQISANDLFHLWAALQSELEDTEKGSCSPELDNTQVDGDAGNGQCNKLQGNDGAALNPIHLRHLLRFLQEHFKDTSSRLVWMKQEGVVSYKMLWAFFTPGLAVRRMCHLSGQACYAEIQSAGKYEHESWAPDENRFEIKLDVMDYNADRYRKCTMTVKIDEYDGEVPFTSLLVCPWSFVSEEERHCMEETISRRGNLFYTCAVEQPFHFMHFQGSMGFYERIANGCLQLRRVNADGRVMVDLLSFARTNPDWPLGNAQPPVELMRGIEGEQKMAIKQKKPSGAELRFAPAVVYGFSFSLKKWGCFDVGGLRKIQFNDEAYEQLVMENVRQKEMLKAIVSSHLSDEDERGRALDMVAGKGEGCIVLCYGPPGTGKTLTAETLAETLRRPLWAISAFELGQEADELEVNLRQVLSTAAQWRAVVLLDEADAYLERRTVDVDIYRNLMTGVFLRLLEYYAGVLFLTTNRIGAFDEAFMSRISLCIRFQSLDDQRRALIWHTLLKRAGLDATPISEDKVNGLVQCGHPLNGREIRNIISLAHTWAQSCRLPLNLSHVQDALQLVIRGYKELAETYGDIAS